MQPLPSIASLPDGEPASIRWLGATMHLAPDQVMRVLQDAACCAAGSAIHFDYQQTAYTPQMLEHMLRYFGFRHIEHGEAERGLGFITATV